MHKFLVSAYNSQDFAHTQENFARLHDHETVKFRNSVFTKKHPQRQFKKKLHYNFCS